jgi:uncharacterized protein
MKKISLILVTFLSISVFSQEKLDITINPLIKGTLIQGMDQMYKTNLTILIAGSGPTDRDGNQATIKNNSLKFLAEGIVNPKNDVFTFDKRIFAQMASGKLDEKNLLFTDMITDVQDIIAYFKVNYKYKKIIIAGHSEGSLIGMIAANGNADAFISIAGSGRPMDIIVEEQIAKQAPTMVDEIHKNFEILRTGKTFENKNALLNVLFRESVQPYLISWMKYNPQDEIKKLKIPTLIVNGTKDVQVGVIDAELLKKAKPNAKLEIITNMNHILKEIKGDNSENIESYSNPNLPVMDELITKMNAFIGSL